MALSLDVALGSGTGWQAAVTTAFERYHPRIVGSLTRTVRDHDLAEDLAAEAFARLASAAASGRPPDDPCAWLHRVANNLVVDDARRARRVRAYAPRLVDASTPDGPEESAVHREEVRRLQRALRSLPEDQQAALTLAAAGWSSREIGTRLGRTDVGVRTILCRARRRLREEIEAASLPLAEPGARPSPVTEPVARPRPVAALGGQVPTSRQSMVTIGIGVETPRSETARGSDVG